MGRHSGEQDRDGEHENVGWRGGHRSQANRRGVSIGVIVAVITVVVVIAGVIVWRFFGDSLSQRSTSAAEQCIKGTATVAVVADPSIADEIKKFGDSYNEQATPVGDQCIKVVVKKSDSDAVIDGFGSKWPGELGDQPALWIPASTVSSARLQGLVGKETVSDDRSLVASPVLLGVRLPMKDALAQQGWATLPGLQSNPTALDSLNLPGWGSLRLALPTVGSSDASYLAAEAVSTASAPPNSPPTAGLGAVNELIAARPRLDEDTADAAWNSLVGGGDPAAGPVHAMVITEQQLFQRMSALQDAKSTVAAWLPPGPVALADYPTVLLAGPWLSDEQVSGASEFARFMRQPAQLAELGKAGFRAEGTTPPNTGIIEFAALAAPLAVGDDSMRATLARALSVPATSTTTIMIDQSMTDLASATRALGNRLTVLPPSSAVGLWTFDGSEGRSVVSTGPLSDQVNGTDRGAVLAGALGGMQEASGGAVSFTTLRLLYGEALANFRPDQPNSVLVITKGPHTDRTLDGPGLQQYLQSAQDPGRPIKINVIDIGDDPDRPTWESVAQLSGGTFQTFPSPDSPDVAGAITALLS